ncbi:MAG: NUDIX domain-containing protein [Candidatus Taylorbacteria bacterium]|nr:NUDIX domain-containing protein [Candidatus Taylorbacteria bacterium]
MTPQVGVKVFLKNKDGKYLLLRRSAERYPDVKGVWDVVGGRINPGSPLLENLKREVKEETGLSVISEPRLIAASEPRLIAAQDIIADAEKHVVRLTYIADTAGEPMLDISEHREYKWLTIKEVKKQDKLDIHVREIIEKGWIK